MKRLLIILFMISSCFAGNMAILGVKETTEGFLGLFATLELEVVNGSGRVYFNTIPLAETDTQASARLAVEVACQTLEMNCNNKDFFYTINTDSPMIGGPSAGAAMAILAMSELLNKPLYDNVAITGTINPDKSIGVVGGVVEKAKVLENSKFDTILIPAGTKYLFRNESLSVKIVEVSTITEAFSYFSGIIFSEPSSVIDKSGFNDFMKVMSEELISYSNLMFDDLIKKNVSSIVNASEYLEIEAAINYTLDDIKKMNELYGLENYYSASSYSVKVSINSLYLNYLADYLIGNFNLSEMVDEMNDSILEFEKKFDTSLLIDNANDFEAISISIERMFEAKELLSLAADYMNNNDSYNALYNLAFAKVRLKTSESWFGLKDLLVGDYSYEFNQYDFRELAYTRIENAKTLLNYANSMQESYYTVSASELIDKSYSAYLNGDIIYSLFESLKSISNSNLALSLAGINDENLNQRISLLMDLAAKNINSVTAKGIIPILAYSYYEYGQTLNESDTLDAVIFFEYSKQFSLLSEQLINEAIPKTENENVNITAYLPSFAISLLIGIFFSLTVLEVYYESASLNKRKR